MRKPVATIFTATLLLLSACEQTQSWGGGESIGTLGGAAAGGLAGSALGGGAAGTLAGVLLGGFIGNRLGATVDESDRQQASKAAQKAYTAPIGQQITWNNTQNGDAGTITPIRDGYAQNGAYCREFQQVATINGKQQEVYGKACQQPDGSWKVVQ